MIILDVGAGTAGCASILAASPDDTVVAVDNNIQYLKRHGPAPGKRAVSRVVADAARVPIRSDRIDTVVCTEMLEHVPNYQAVIAELSRVGRPGCGYLFSVPVARWEHLYQKLHPDWLANSGHKNIFTIAVLTRALNGSGLRIAGYRGANSWSCLYWFCHALARSDFNDAGLALNHRGIDAAFNRLERLLLRLRLWSVFIAVGDRLWPKSWVIHAAKN